MHFGENQLSRSLIGLSPLPTGHPPGFQPWWVRSSTRSYPRFNLPMGRSLRFGSTTCDSDALFRLAFATATPHGLTLPHIVTRRLILQKARGHFTLAEARSLPRLVGTRFQVLFHDPSPGGFSPFAHHYSGNRGCFLFLRVLRCFTSPRYLHLPYVFRQGRWAITLHRVSPFGNPRIEVWLPTPRGLSQAPTSFIGSWCLGIHRVPLLTWQLQI